MNIRKIHILHVLHGLPIGGAEMLLVQYIKALGTKDYQHYVFSFGPDGPVKNILQDMSVPVYLVKDRDTILHPFRFTHELALLIKKLFDYTKKNNIDLIQSHTGHSNELAMLVANLCNVPYFPTIHSTKPFLTHKVGFHLGKTLLKMIDYYLYRKADRVIAVSTKIATLIKQKYNLPDSNVIVIENGICLKKSELNSCNVCDEKKNSNNSFKIIAVGRLVPLKSFETLIKAAKYLKDKTNIKLSISIIGDGPERNKLEKLIKDLKLNEYVSLYGLSLNVFPLLKSSDAFVITSKYEGLSMAMIEAMACGLPVIASNGPGLRDNVTHNINGLIFPVDDFIELAKTILLLATNKELQNHLAKQSIDHFEKNYNMERNIKRLKNAFLSLYLRKLRESKKI